MRARLNTMAAGQEFRFLCIEKMAEKMDRIVALGGGEIFAREDRSYGVVIAVRRRSDSNDGKEKKREQETARRMSEQQNNDPLHGVTLAQIVNFLVDCHGWDKLGQWINIRCFNSNPSVNSSLKFLRKTPWARTKVENLYLATKKRTLKRRPRA